MVEHDLRRTDSYALHLAAVNQKREVLATEDIRNESGVLLVKKGLAIKAETAQRLLNHRLLAPLETSVSIANALDAKSFYYNVIALLNQDAQSEAIHRNLQLDPMLKQLCLAIKQYPLIVQKLTVMSERMPLEYNKALYCAWFAAALTQQMRWEAPECREAFFAGLTQNMGLLHIDPIIAEKTGTYTPEEWRAVQSHPLIGDVFLSHVPNISSDVRRAVREHHERCDGSGYPAALWGNNLSILGQVTAMADTVWGLLKVVEQRKCKSFADVMTIIKMNKAQYPEAVESALYHLANKAQAGESHRSDTVSPEAALPHLHELQQQLRVQYQSTAPLQELLAAGAKEAFMRSAYVKYQRIWFTVNGSGLLEKELLVRKEEGAHDGSDFSEAHELSLMYAELHWQLFQLERTLEQVLSAAGGLDPDTRSRMALVVNSLRTLIQND